LRDAKVEVESAAAEKYFAARRGRERRGTRRWKRWFCCFVA
jgi:hypothetical protein